MALHAMPLLVANLGGEMVYILEQRLNAQGIGEEKSCKVINDVVGAMLNENFLNELFKPHELYSNSSIKGIFDKLAHSSIMRLSESSMNKLYDLMTMGFKYQMMCCKFPQELLQVTFNHLTSMKSIVQGAVAEKMEQLTSRIQEKYGKLSVGQFNILRQTLLKFLQDKRIKVSLFLQEKLQLPTGVIILQGGGPLPLRVEMPGTIRYFDNDGKMSATSFQYAFNSLEPRTAETPPTKLGLNLYSTPNKDKVPLEAVPIPSPEQTQVREDIPSTRDNVAAKAEINLLAHLIGGAKAGSDMFKINNLFPDNFLSTSSGNLTTKDTSTVTVDASLSNKNQELVDIMEEFSIEDDTEQASQETEELLDLINN